MLLLVATILNLAASACGGNPQRATAPAPPSISIDLARGSGRELETRSQLQRLLKTYNLSPWLYTKRVVIDESAIPHSHPVLTLHTRHLDDDLHLLSTFIHEQMHWFVDSRPQQLSAATAELRKLFPQIAIGFPDGARTEASSYEHLVVIYLEWKVLEQIAGHARAQRVFTFWSTDHYRALYRLVMTETERVGRVVKTHALVPPSAS